MGITRHGVAAFISPKIPDITKCVCVDVAQEFPNRDTWLASFFLKVALQNHAAPDTRALCVQLLRRAESALDDYSAACELMRVVAGGGGTKWAEYFKALYRFEATLSQLYQSYDYARRALGTKAFESNDGTPLDRLNRLNNAIKHQVAGTDQPVWLSDAGVECDGVLLKWDEIADLLRSSGRIAERIVLGA